MTQPAKYWLFSYFALIAITVLTMPSVAFGQLTYHEAVVDVAGGTLSAADGIDAFDAIDLITPGANVGDDNLWRLRGIDADAGNRFGASGTVFESSEGEDAPELVQTIEGLGANAMVDVYVVWWSDPGNWNVRAGLSSNPGGNQLYDRTGATGEAGTLGVFADWASLPPDNPDIVDGLTGIEAATLEGNRTLLIAKVGTGTADSSGDLPVFIDDNFGGSDRSWFDGLATAPVGSTVNSVTATIDRTTGNLSLNSSIVDYSVTALSITSGSGSLNAGNWNSITGNLDGAGNSTFDSDNWEITSSSSQNLAENEIADPAPVSAGGIFGPSGAGAIDFGDVWNASPFEDVTVNLTLESGTTVAVAVQFTGGTSQILGDFDNDTDIDVDDYAVVLNGLNQDLGGLTDFESYPLGDINGDQVTNFNDLVVFRDVFDAANGAGAFAALVANVPEPGSLALMAMATIGVALKRRGRSLAIVLLLALVCVPSGAQAQLITYVDADHNTNTAAESGSPTFPAGPTDFQGPTGDGLWDLRTFANGGTIYQSRGFNGNDTLPEDAHRLVTTISGLTNSETYEVFAYFWSDDPSMSWRINAGLTNDVLPQFNPTNSPAAVEADFLNDPLPLVTEGNRTLYQAELGIAIANGSGEIPVFIDDNDPVSMGHNDRTWYDGVGFRIAPPELTIEVNTTTGAITIVNPTDAAIDLSYYEITSPGNSLNPAGWNSLDAQNIDAVDDRGGVDPGTVAGDSLLEGWDVAGASGSLEGDHDGNGTVNADDLTTWRAEFGTTLNGGDFLDWQRNLGESGGGGEAGSASLLNETNLLGQSTVASMTGSLSLGNAYDTSVGVQDLVFRYGTVDDGELTLGRVSFVSSASTASAVPEPSTALLAGLALVIAYSRKRNRK